MTSIIASNVPATVSVDKIKEFFSFSGKVSSVDSVSSSSYKVTFASPEAVSSALLLSGAELDGSEIQVAADGAGTGATSDTKVDASKIVNSSIAPNSSTVAAAAAVPFTDKKSEAAPASGDIEQEHKPKSAIVAEYLAHGYVLSDQAVEKAVALDQKHGISSKFKNFLSGLDSKYHVQDRTVETANSANKKFGLEEKYAKGRNDLSSYLEKAAQSPTGSKIHSFYTDIVKDTKDIHNEARRLADLKKASVASGSADAAADKPTA